MSRRYTTSFDLVKKVTIDKLRKSQEKTTRLRDKLSISQGRRADLQTENTALREVGNDTKLSEKEIRRGFRLYYDAGRKDGIEMNRESARNGRLGAEFVVL
jgi:hypothetical protein